MPIYECVCRKCGKAQDYVRPVSQCMDTPECCGEKTQKVILSAPMGIVDIPAYVSPVSGKWINSRAERKEDLKRSNCREWEGMEQEVKGAQTRAKEEDKKLDQALEKTIGEAYAALPSEKKRVLEQAI